ncbi:MAG: nucleotide exchange factor GrpE [Candidatus Rariloculaceae bacterium]
MANDFQEEDDPLATPDGEKLKNKDLADAADSPDAEKEGEEQTPPPTELDVARQEANENLERYLRLAAELENLRKRSARELENARKYGLERLAQSLLPVRDSLSAGVANAENADVDVLLEGKRATLRLLDAALEQVGIVELDPEGEPFDPARHEAITMQPSTTSEPNTVLTVVQTGYAIHDRLLRPARVIVAQEEPATEK